MDENKMKMSNEIGCNPVNEITDVESTDSKNIINMTRKLNATDEFIDFTTYMKIVNFFFESDSVIAVIDADQESLIDITPHVVKDDGSSIKTDHEETGKNKTGNTDQLVTLHVLSGEKIKVSMNNFHGISISGDGFQCRLCIVTVEDILHMEAHKMEMQHMNRIASAISNKHCIRKIGPIWNHCILCNELIENIQFHLKFNTAHTEHLERALKLSKNANVCTTSAEKSVKSYLLNNPETTSTVVHQTTNNINQIEEKFVNQKLESHIKKELLLKDRKIFATGKISVVDNDTSLFTSNENFKFCHVCNRKMFSNQLKSHMEGKSHKAQLMKIKNEAMKEADINYYLPNGSKDETTKTNKQKSKQNSVPDKNKEGRNVETNGTNKKHLGFKKSVLTSNECENEDFCHICNREVQSDQLKAHMKGKSHKTHLLKMNNKGIKIDLQSGSGLKNIKLNQQKPQKNAIPKEKEKFVANGTGPKHFKIIYKDSDVSNVELNGTDKKHFAINNDKKVLATNKCENVAFCIVCNRKMQSNQFDAHIKGNPHKAQLLKIKNEVATITCDLPSGSGIQNTRTKEYQHKQNSVSNETDVNKNKIYKDKEERNGEAHGIDKKHADRIRAIIDKPNTISNTTNTEKLISKNEKYVLNKVYTGKYDKEYTNILNRNTIRPVPQQWGRYGLLRNESTIKTHKKNVLYCEACQVSMYAGAELVHIKNEHHKERVTEISSSVVTNKLLIYCDSCNAITYLSQDEIYRCYIEKCCTAAIFYKHCVVFVDFDKLYCCYCSEYLCIHEVFPHIVTLDHLSKSETEHPTPYIICYQMKSCDQERCLDCQICKERIFKSTFAVMQHLYSYYHISAYRKLLVDNNINFFCENMLYCTTCNVLIKVQNEISHIIDHQKHRQMLKKSDQLLTLFQKSLIAIGFCLLLFYFCGK